MPTPAGAAQAEVRLAGAVLTGGASRRMGTNKALLTVDGVPMASRVAAALRGAGCDPVVLIGGDEALLGELGEMLVRDDHPGEGPLGAIATALRWACTSADLLLVASCDLAHLGSGDLVGLTDTARECATSDEFDVIVARTDRIEPMCAVWMTSALATVERSFARGERSVHGVLSTLRMREVAVDPCALRNINTPHDLAQ
jgi:molybdenum cofactor guanylyltransferase